MASKFEFRDCIVEVDSGLVQRYVDKVMGVYLTPSEGIDNWSVFGESGEPTGQIWRGIIAFDGAQLLIQQARNSLFRLYRTDGTVETQLRISRLVERSDSRTLMFLQGDSVDEDLASGTRTVAWAERSANDDSDSVSPDVLAAFKRFLQQWDELKTDQVNAEFHVGGLPGLTEAAPGKPFSRACDGKPDDFREVHATRFTDGTALFEYVGRLSGVPFIARELVLNEQFVLARWIEYDQPKPLTLRDPRGIIRSYKSVQSMKMQFDPVRCDYAMVLAEANGTEHVF